MAENRLHWRTKTRGGARPNLDRGHGALRSFSPIGLLSLLKLKVFGRISSQYAVWGGLRHRLPDRPGDPFALPRDLFTNPLAERRYRLVGRYRLVDNALGGIERGARALAQRAP